MAEVDIVLRAPFPAGTLGAMLLAVAAEHPAATVACVTKAGPFGLTIKIPEHSPGTPGTPDMPDGELAAEKVEAAETPVAEVLQAPPVPVAESDRPIWLKHREPKPSTAEAMHPARSGELLADLNESVKAIEEKRHVCRSCDRVFASAAGLDSHRRWQHQSPPGAAPKPAPTERLRPAPARAPIDGLDWPWKCACGHGTGQRVEMIRHINVKGGTKGGHRIVEQPPPRLVPSGVNTRPDTDRARAAAFTDPGGELAD